MPRYRAQRRGRVRRGRSLIARRRGSRSLSLRGRELLGDDGCLRGRPQITTRPSTRRGVASTAATTAGSTSGERHRLPVTPCDGLVLAAVASTSAALAGSALARLERRSCGGQGHNQADPSGSRRREAGRRYDRAQVGCPWIHRLDRRPRGRSRDGAPVLGGRGTVVSRYPAQRLRQRLGQFALRERLLWQTTGGLRSGDQRSRHLCLRG